MTLLYENVLDREADQPGFEFWLSVLGILQDNASQAPTARERLLLAFAESDENRNGSPMVEPLPKSRLVNGTFSPRERLMARPARSGFLDDA